MINSVSMTNSMRDINDNISNMEQEMVISRNERVSAESNSFKQVAAEKQVTFAKPSSALNSSAHHEVIREESKESKIEEDDEGNSEQVSYSLNDSSLDRV